MAFYHGIKTSEQATSIKPSITTANLPVVVGTAPINLAVTPKVNEPILLYTLAEVYEYFGYSDDVETYTLSEAAKVFFQLYGMAPVCFINVLDPEVHKKSVSATEFEIDKANQCVKLPLGLIKETLVVKDAASEVYVEGKDYVTAFDSKGHLVVSFVVGGAILTSENTWAVEKVSVAYEEIDPSAVTKDDVIGGYDTVNDKYEGLELIDKVFSYFRKLPTMILAPKYCENPEVAAIMDTKADYLNTVFRCISIVDIPETITKYTDVPDTKNQNNLMNPNQIVCWPKVKLGDDVYRMSVQLAGLMMAVDYSNNDVPKESPSNKQMKINGSTIKVGEEFKDIYLTLDQANYLNENGIVTAINFANGWTAWGNRTACYPSNTDPKDSFIPAKRLMQYYDNSFVLTHWVDVDKPTTQRLIDTIINSRNHFYNGEVAAENILAGRIEFVAEENPITNLLDGKIQFHNYITPPLPAEQIISKIEIDPNGYNNLF